MSVYGYVRVSTSRQADEGESLSVQQRQIKAYGLLHDLNVDHTYIERGVSGSRPLDDRPQGKLLLKKLKEGDEIITPKLDRMFRSARDALLVLEQLKNRGIKLHMIDLGGDVTGNGISKLVFTILSAVAEAERDRIRERACDVKNDQRAQGRYLGGIVPFGHVVKEDGTIEVDPEKMAVLEECRYMRAEGNTLAQIAKFLSDEHAIKVSLSGLHGLLKDVVKPRADERRRQGRAVQPAEPFAAGESHGDAEMKRRPTEPVEMRV